MCHRQGTAQSSVTILWPRSGRVYNYQSGLVQTAESQCFKEAKLADVHKDRSRSYRSAPATHSVFTGPGVNLPKLEP